MKADLETGMRISIFIPQSVEREIKRTLSLSSIIEEIINDEYILIHMPTYRGFLFPLPEEPVVMRFFHNSIPYSMQIEYIEKQAREGFVLAKMRRVSPPERHQMREHFRLSCHLPAVLRCVKTKGSDESEGTDESEGVEETKSAEESGLIEESEHECTVLDLSEGGMLILTNAKLETSEKVSVSVEIGSQMELKGTVLRITDVTEGRYRYKVGLRFREMRSAQADGIYKFIVDAQLAQRRTRRV